MIKVIKSGKKTFATTCGVCGCIFNYESEDIQHTLDGSTMVCCPCCNSYCPHKLDENGYGFYVTVDNKGV